MDGRMRTRTAVMASLAAVALLGCDSESPSGSTTPGISIDGITLSRADLFQGCAGVDCIPAIDNPQFVGTDGLHGVGDGELIVGIVVDGSAFAYPYAVLNWHEVVNQVTPSGVPLCVSYCPLTSSSVVFRRDMIDGAPEFGVSGLLWRSNLILYDRKNASLWSQMRLSSVTGTPLGKPFDMIGAFEMTWGAWRAIHPETQVLTRSTGHRRNYGTYPYFDYWTNGLFYIPQPFVDGDPAPPHFYDDRYPAKGRVHGVVAGGLTAAFVMHGADEVGVTLDNTAVGGVPVLMIRGDLDPTNNELELAHSLERTVDGQVLTFDIAPETADQFPWLLLDRETGTRWTLTGEAVAGPLTGQRLRSPISYNAFWFAWAGFWSGTVLR